MPHIVEVLGLLGVFGINVAYVMISSGKMRPNSYVYPLINFCGATLIMIALVPQWNLAAFLMELSWALISLFSMIAIFRSGRKP